MELVAIPGGVLRMGSTAAQVEACVATWSPRLIDPTWDVERFRQWILKEFPQHPVRVARFALARFPVTNREYAAFLAVTARALPESLAAAEPDDHPVWGVSWDDANAYAAWLSGRKGRVLRLPTEAEWEFAARGDADREYPYGDAFDPALCNTVESGIGHTTPVDRYPYGASAFGICDLAGNVEEWTADCYAPYPGGRFIADDLVRLVGPEYRILRGGSFALGGDLARCARRHGRHPGALFRFTGFRLAADEA
ncbi:MAG TPA: SUMF1/EgtB/PvdO family nonheme iron enzyme [Dehalococcoidia bacterium]|nr:SUMF1/EgtB/PvdO family nonheme iron enzyme [Dehalococcoidia bacterium]